MSDSFVGKQFDEYLLEELLGQGGMAQVYRARDTRLKRYAAIKVIDTRFRSKMDYIKRFEREAQAIAQLQHPNIVSVYRYGEVENILYIAMQYIEGADFHTVLASYQQDGEYMQTQDVLRIITEICSALDYAHSKGVIHRDIKPSNIMLNKQGSAILTDFGLALLTDIGTQGEIFGSPHYIAPEQAVSSAKVVPQSDLYALGVILYEIFTNVLPFDGSDYIEVARMHVVEQPRPPREIRPEVSREVEAMILKALAKDPQERFASGAELAQALGSALATKPLVTPSMAERKSMLDRVHLEMEAYPLPPLPAGMVTPQNIPPISVPVAPPVLQQQNYPTLVSRPPISTVPAVTLPAPSHRSNKLLYGGMGIGAIVGAILLIGLFLFLFNDDPNAITEATPTISADIQTTEINPIPTTDLNATLAAQPSPTPFGNAVIPSLPPTIMGSVFVPTTLVLPATEVSPSVAQETALALVPTQMILPTEYRIIIMRYGKDKAVYIKNIGEIDLPLDTLEISSKEDDFEGDNWGVELLPPGGCVRAWKVNELKGSGKKHGEIEEDALDDLDLECELIGDALRLENKSTFWTEDMTILFDGQEVGECEKEDSECEFRFSS